MQLYFFRESHFDKATYALKHFPLVLRGACKLYLLLEHSLFVVVVKLSDTYLFAAFGENIG